MESRLPIPVTNNSANQHHATTGYPAVASVSFPEAHRGAGRSTFSTFTPLVFKQDNQMNQTIACTFLAGLLAAVTTVAQDTDPDNSLPAADKMDAVDGATYDQAWSVTIAQPPEILRLHCPPLRGEAGVWVRKVDPNGQAAARGIRTGDILLRADGRTLAASKRLPAPDQVLDLVVLRQGQIRFIAPVLPNFPKVHAGDDWMLDRSVSTSAFSGDFAGAFANDESGAVAVSQVGDQINLQMTLPELGDQPVRFRGTRQQIEQQLQKSTLTADGKQRVRRALAQ